MKLKSYENKLFGKYLSPDPKELSEDNLFKSLYVSKYTKYFMSKKDDHMVSKLSHWKSLTKDVKHTPSEGLGNILKMNIHVDGKNLFTKHKKAYTDVELTKTKNGLYRPVIRGIRGGAQGAVGLVPSNSVAVNTHSNNRTNVAPLSRCARSQNSSIETQTQAVVEIKMDNNYRLILNKADVEELKVNDFIINNAALNVNVSMKSDELEKIISAGYCIFNNEGYIQNLHISMYSFFGLNKDSESDVMLLKKIVYVLYFKDTRQLVGSLKNPFPITSDLSFEMKGGKIRKAIKNTNTNSMPNKSKKATSKGGSLTPEIDVIKIDQNKPTRSIFFIVLLEEVGADIRLHQLVLKLINVSPNPILNEYHEKQFINEAQNYRDLGSRDMYLKNMNSGLISQYETFFDKHITRYFNCGRATCNNTNFTFKLNASSENCKDPDPVNDAPPGPNEKRLMFPINKIIPSDINIRKFYYIMEHDCMFQTFESAMLIVLNTADIAKIEVLDMYNAVIDTHTTALKLYGFYHGDLKPDNVLIDIETRSIPKIFDLDFSGFVFSQEQLINPLNDRIPDQTIIKRNADTIKLFKIENLITPQYSNPSISLNLNTQNAHSSFEDSKAFKEINIVSKLHAHDIWRMFYTVYMNITTSMNDLMENTDIRWMSLKELYDNKIDFDNFDYIKKSNEPLLFIINNKLSDIFSRRLV